MMITPSSAGVGSSRRAAVIGALPLLPLVVIFGGRVHSVLFWAALCAATIAAAAASTIGLQLFLRNARVFGSESSFGRVTAFGQRLEYPRDSLLQVVRARIAYGGRVAPADRIIFLGRDGTPIMTLASTLWKREDITALLRTLQVQFTDVEPAPIEAAELRRRWPSAIPWWHAHTVLVAVGVVIAGCAVIAVLIQWG